MDNGQWTVKNRQWGKSLTLKFMVRDRLISDTLPLRIETECE